MWPRSQTTSGIDRFAVMGLSSGGPYVAACASLLGDRVVAAAAVAGVTDMGWSAAYDDFPDDDEKTITRLGDEDNALTWCEDRYGADGARFFDEPLDLSPPDTALFEDEAFMAAIMPTFAEAFRQGVGGFAQDITVQGVAWPFDVASISCEMRVYHGEQDTLVPVSHGRHTAEMIEGSTLVLFPEHGHISMITEVPRAAADLARGFEKRDTRLSFARGRAQFRLCTTRSARPVSIGMVVARSMMSPPITIAHRNHPVLRSAPRNLRCTRVWPFEADVNKSAHVNIVSKRSARKTRAWGGSIVATWRYASGPP
jgi:hypothetical protein